MILQNQTNCNVKVQLYDIICRRDLTAGATYYDPWINGLADKGTYDNTNIGFFLLLQICLHHSLKYVK